MKVKNKLKGKLIVGIAIIAVLSILGSNMLNIVHATSNMQKNNSNQTVTVKDNYGNTISLTNPTNATHITDLEGVSTENGVQYEKIDLSNENEESNTGGNEGSNIGTTGSISVDEMTRIRDAFLRKNQFSDPTYSFSFTLDENTRMVSWKNVNIAEYKKDDTDITFLPDNDDKSSNFGVYIYNAGIYMDSEGKIHNINLKLTFSWESWKINNENQYPYINIRTYSKGIQEYGLYFSFENMTYATKIDIYDGDPANDNNKIKINMNMKLVDIDDRQFFGVGKFNGEGKAGLSNHINKIQYLADSTVYTDITPTEHYDDYTWFYADGALHDNDMPSAVRLELKDVNSFSFVNGTKHDPCSFNYGDRFYLTASDYYNYDYSQNPETNSRIREYLDYITNDATYPPAMVGYFTNEPFYPYDVATPIERIDDVNQTNVTTNEIGKSEEYTYKVYHYVPSATELWYYSSYSINAPIPEAVEYKNAKVYEVSLDSNGQEKLTDVSDKFMFLNTDNNISAIAKQNNNTTTGISNSISPDSGFYSKIYLMKINVTEKDYRTKSNSSEESDNNLTKTYRLNHKSSVGAAIVGSSITLNQYTNQVSTDYKEIKIPITKIWEDSSNAANLRPEKITYSIIAVTSDGTPVHTYYSGEITTDSNNTKEVYSGFVPLKNENEQFMIYQVSEGNVPNYTGEVEYTKNGDQITKVTITNTLNEIPKTTGIVNYYLKGTTQKIRESRNLSNLTIGDTLTAETYKENILHYTYDSSSPSNLAVNEDATKNIINLYYTLTPYEYTVRYYYDGVEDETATETDTANFGETITEYEDKSKETYKLQKTENVPLTISDTPSNNIMKIYYITNENEDEYAYTIKYYYDGIIDNSLTETGTAKLGATKTYTNNTKNGTYKLDSVNPTSGKIQITEDEDKNIIHVYYVKNENPTTDARIITKYIDKDTGKEIADSKTENTKIGEKYNTEKKDIKDYSYVSDTGNTSGTVNEPEIEVIYYYEPLREIIIKYVDKQTGKEIADPSTNNGKTGDKFDITSKKQEINGYTLVEEPTEKEATYGKDPQIFTYYYSKNSKIIVRYVDEDTGEQIEKEIEKSGTVGQKFDISDTEKNIANYYLVKRPDSLTGKYTENEQIFTFYYRKDPGLANKAIPKTGMNEFIRNTSIIALLIVLSNGLRLFVRYKKEEKRSIR